MQEVWEAVLGRMRRPRRTGTGRHPARPAMPVRKWWDCCQEDSEFAEQALVALSAPRPLTPRGRPQRWPGVM